MTDHTRTIEDFFKKAGIPTTVVSRNVGNRLTQYLTQSNTNKLVIKPMQKLTKELQRATSAIKPPSIYLVAGTGYVAIDISHELTSPVLLSDVMQSADLLNSLDIPFGRDVAGNVIAKNLTGLPHLLIAGATGSGKSVCINAIITCLLQRNASDVLRFLMIDPKRVELTGYNGVPHLMRPVATDTHTAAEVLGLAVEEMDARYTLLQAQQARNIRAYNKAVLPKDRMPYIAVVIDELADLMMVSPQETEDAITRLAQMGRAAGIHLIVATQRPDADVVTGLIKANLPTRIAFRVADGINSRIIIGRVGAESLLGQGDALIQTESSSEPLRFQSCYISDEEIDAVVNAAKNQ